MKMRSSKLASTPPSGWCRQATPPQAPGAGCILLLPSSCAVAAGILPGGSAASNATKSGTSGWGPGGKMPPSTAGRMPAATGWRCARAGQGCIKLLRSMRQGWVLISLSETNPAGLAAGSRWSARAKGADHRVNAVVSLLSTLPGQGLILQGNERFWHPSRMQECLTRLSGGRFPCCPETTPGYQLPTLPGWTGQPKPMGRPHVNPRRHALIRA
jgi:hypothetical protein